jgi:hypothetical protein
MVTATILLALASLLGVSTASSISTTKVGGVINPFNMPGPVIMSIPAPTVFSGHTSTHTGEYKTVETGGRLETEKPGSVFLTVPAPVISRISEHAKTTEEVARAVKTSDAHLAVEKPGPVFLSVPGPFASRVSELAKTKTEDVARALATTAPIHPVEKPGPIFTYIPEPVLSRASEARKTKTHNLARGLDYATSSTLRTFVSQSTSQPHLHKTRPNHSTTNTVTKRSEADVPVVTKVTVDPATATFAAPPSFGTKVVRRDNPPNKNDTSISPSTIGWIVAIIFGVLMTVVCVILLHTKMSDRRRNAAARRHFREI